MNYFAQLRALTSGILLGGLLAIGLDALGVSRLAIVALIGTFSFYVLLHDVRRILANTTGIDITWMQAIALCTIGPATSMWMRFMCFMNGHTNLTTMIDTKHEAFGESFLRSLVVRCGRCHRVVRPATKDEAEAYMRDRMSQMSIAIEASFAPLREAMKGAGDAIREFATATTSAFDSLDKQRRRRNAPPPS